MTAIIFLALLDSTNVKHVTQFASPPENLTVAGDALFFTAQLTDGNAPGYIGTVSWV